MRLSWNEIRIRAAGFARDWAGEGYEKGQTQLFYRDFFNIFGVPVRRVASFEEPVWNLGERRGFIDLFWKGVLLVEQKSSGRNLVKAKEQALAYFPGLKDTELPRFILLSDFQNFELYDLDEGKEYRFPLVELPQQVEKFGFIMGVQQRTFKDQDPVNIRASELVGRLHDSLKDAGYTGHDLEQLLVRIVFCLFADDTGIFEPRDIFEELLISRTREDGSDLGGWLIQLFQILDTPENERQKNLDEDLARFPYVNGELFKGNLRIPSFDADKRSALLEACQFDWSMISPAIFGALFQSVMELEERRSQGAHYTIEKNILKVIQPLFLDDLWAEFEMLKRRKDTHRKKLLQEFHHKLGGLTFFDPACGCGNFLIIAYRELRALEIEVIREIRAYGETAGQDVLDAAELSIVNVDQFYGIEISEFPVRIAETAMWMMDHIMNNKLSLEFGQSYVRIPLRRSPRIINVDALDIDWTGVISPDKCSFIYGNPPFAGSKYQSDLQRAQVKRIAALGRTGGSLDFVTAWFIKAADFVQQGGNAKIGFVATNSITQGEQVAQLWPLLFNHGLEIAFAHRTFEWGSDARGLAHVHVVIIGLTKKDHIPVEKRLFTYDNVRGDPHESLQVWISPYLFDASNLNNPHLVVQEVPRPINDLPRLVIGSKPIDGGHYIFSEEEKEAFLTLEPSALPYLHPFIGSREFLNGGARWILSLHDVPPEVFKSLPKTRERVAAVRQYRLESPSEPTQELAQTPTLYHVNVIPTSSFLVIPKSSSIKREYVPIGWLEPPTIPSDSVFVLSGASKSLFAILTSAMHMSWLRHIGGRIKSDYRYSVFLVYNTFPMPSVDPASIEKLEQLAQIVLDTRSAFPDATLSDLYDPDLMPPDLRKAHQALDRAVDRLYRREPFRSDRERAEHLLGLYEQRTAPLIAEIEKKEKSRRHRRVLPKCDVD